MLLTLHMILLPRCSTVIPSDQTCDSVIDYCNGRFLAKFVKVSRKIYKKDQAFSFHSQKFISAKRKNFAVCLIRKSFSPRKFIP